ncbi:MAG: PepSY-like domain-containing protein, partial [Limisphaerales bacterium]
MKTTRYFTAALCGSALIFSANAEQVRFEELPIDLKDKIRAHSGSAPIEDVDRQSKGGKTVYEVGFKKNGQHTEMRFDEKGEPVTAAGNPALDSRKITYNELPEAVRKTLEARVTSGEVNDIDRQVKNGQATYEVGFKQNDRQQELVLSQDGRILNDSPAVGTVAVGAPSGTISGSSANTLMAEPVKLSESQKVQLTQLPAAVQRGITTAAAGARIEDVERGTWQGKNVYQAAFKDNGKHVELQVRENGTILHDPRAVRSAAGTPARLTRGSSPEYASVTSLVPLSAGKKIERNALPGLVQRRLYSHIATDKIEDIEQG